MIEAFPNPQGEILPFQFLTTSRLKLSNHDFHIRQQASCKKHFSPILPHALHDAYRALYLTN